jgi:hypothetical protein
LQNIAETMDAHRLCETRLAWVNPIPRNSEDGGYWGARIGEEFMERRQKMLPSDEALAALGHISNCADLPDRDLIQQRIVELLLCGGFRICEALTLPVDCWIEEPECDEDGIPMVGPGGRPAIRYGIRYIPEKGGHEVTQVKWIPTVMADIAKRALDDIKRITAPFRAIATFISENPGRTLLAEPWHSLPGETLLTHSDIYEILGFKGKCKQGVVLQFLSRTHTPIRKTVIGKRLRPVVMKADLEKTLVTISGDECVFPQGQGHFSLHESLCVLGVNFIHKQRALVNGTAVMLTDGQIRDYAVGRKGIPSIFQRLGLIDEKGVPFKLPSHKPRHWLNTKAEEGGMSQMGISRFFGRKDIGQNAEYNHMTGYQMAKSIREKRRRGEIRGPVTDAALTIKDPARREEFIASQTVTYHETDLGGCEHDWSALPCPKHQECTVCNEATIEKGNKTHEKNTAERLARAETAINLARAEEKDGTHGANNWLAHQELVASRARRILKIHADPSIPDGTLIQLSASEE